MSDAPSDTAPYIETPAEIRHPGVMVAVHAPEPAQRTVALEVLRSSGAQDIETADGIWRSGKWVDFDPVAKVEHEPKMEGRQMVMILAPR